MNQVRRADAGRTDSILDYCYCSCRGIVCIINYEKLDIYMGFNIRALCPRVLTGPFRARPY